MNLLRLRPRLRVRHCPLAVDRHSFASSGVSLDRWRRALSSTAADGQRREAALGRADGAARAAPASTKITRPFFLDEEVDRTQLSKEKDLLISQLQDALPSTARSAPNLTVKALPVFMLSRCERLLSECIAAGAMKEAEELSSSLLPIVTEGNWGLLEYAKSKSVKSKENERLEAERVRKHEAVLLSLMLEVYREIGNRLTLYRLVSMIQSSPEVPLTEEGVAVCLSFLLEEGRPSDAVELLKKVLKAPVGSRSEVAAENVTEVIIAGSEDPATNQTSVFQIYELAKQDLGFTPNLPCAVAVVRALSSAHNLDMILSLKDELAHGESSPHPKLTHAIVTACVENHSLVKGLAVYEELLNAGATVDESTYHLLIRACGEAGFVDQSFLIFDEMQKHGYLPSLQAYNALLHACTAVDDSAEGLKKANEIFERMEESGLHPDSGSYFALMNAAANTGDMMRALEILQRMKASGLEPDKRTYEAAIRACANYASPERASDLTVKLTKLGLIALGGSSAASILMIAQNPNPMVLALGSTTFVVMIYGFHSNGKNLLQQIASFMKGGKEYGGGIEGLATHVVRALAEEGSVKRALHVYQKMRKSLNIGVKPDSQTYTLLMQTAIKKHQPGVAYILLTNAQEEGVKIPDVKLMEQFLGELMKAGNSKHARNVFRIGVSQGTWRLSQRREKANDEDIVDLRGFDASVARTAAGVVVEDLLSRAKDLRESSEKHRSVEEREAAIRQIPRYVVLQAREDTKSQVQKALEEDISRDLPWMKDHTQRNAFVLDCEAYRR